MEKNETKTVSKVGRFVGGLFSVTLMGCICALMIVITAKIAHWIIF